MKYHALFVIFEKAEKFEIGVCCQIIGGPLRIKLTICQYLTLGSFECSTREAVSASVESIDVSLVADSLI